MRIALGHALDLIHLENPRDVSPAEPYACPGQAVTLKAYYELEETAGYVLLDSYASRNLLAVDPDVEVISVPGKINNGIVGTNLTTLVTTTDADYWFAQSWTVRLWFKNTADFTGLFPSLIWNANTCGLFHMGTAWAVGWYGWWSDGQAYAWRYIGGNPGAAIPGHDWHRVVCWYCHITGAVGIQIDNNDPVTDLWPVNLGQTCNYFQAGLTGDAVGHIDELAFWKGVLSDAQRLADWNAGAGIGLAGVPGKISTPPDLPTITTLIASDNQCTKYDHVTLSASVDNNAGGGTMTFKDGGVVIATVAFLGGGPALYAIPTPAAEGIHSYTAEYSGYGYHQASTSDAVAVEVVGIGVGGVWPDGPMQVDAATVAVVSASGGNAVTGTVPKVDPQPLYRELPFGGPNGFQLQTAITGYWTVEVLWANGGNYSVYHRDGESMDPVGDYHLDSGPDLGVGKIHITIP